MKRAPVTYDGSSVCAAIDAGAEAAAAEIRAFSQRYATRRDYRAVELLAEHVQRATVRAAVDALRWAEEESEDGRRAA